MAEQHVRWHGTLRLFKISYFRLLTAPSLSGLLPTFWWHIEILHS